MINEGGEIPRQQDIVRKVTTPVTLVHLNALKSKADVFPQKPEVYLKNPFLFDTKEVRFRDEQNEIICGGLVEELRIHRLFPDGHTAYVIDFGTPHLPAISSALLHMGIDSAIYLDPTEEDEVDAGHYSAYIGMYEAHAQEIAQERASLPTPPRGHALLVNSHASQGERMRIAGVLPTVEQLRQIGGVHKLVFGKEAWYSYRIPNITEFPDDDAINKYMKIMAEAGIQIKIIGFDYRQDQRYVQMLTEKRRIEQEQKNEESPKKIINPFF